MIMPLAASKSHFVDLVLSTCLKERPFSGNSESVHSSVFKTKGITILRLRIADIQQLVPNNIRLKLHQDLEFSIFELQCYLDQLFHYRQNICPIILSNFFCFMMK